MGMIRGPAWVVRLALVIIVLATSGSASDTPERFGVGDSIMRSADDELGAIGWRVNAEVGRQFSAGAALIVRERR
jgi:hypothetical protein